MFDFQIITRELKMLKSIIVFIFLLCVHLVLMPSEIFSQVNIEPGDPPNNENVPGFFKSKLSDIDNEVANIKRGSIKVITKSPGGLPVYAIYYGEKENFFSQANYNSAVAAGNPAFYAKKTKETKPVVFFIGPVHGHEVEGIAGLVNLIHIAETGKDYRGKEWASLKSNFEKCRVIIIPCANPDGRRRCPYDSFIGINSDVMHKYGQGTHKDGTLWGWPQTKSLHPMKGDVGILGAYYNDDGINIMQDEFFLPMAEETKSILRIARDEAPDISISLHSYEIPPSILQSNYLPLFMEKRVVGLAVQLNKYYKSAGLPYIQDMPEELPEKAYVEDQSFPPRKTFNLIGALHHVSGTMALTFECSQGLVDGRTMVPIVDYDNILDIELGLYQEVFNYVISQRLYWERK